DVHRGRVLATLFLAVVHVVDQQALPVQLVVLDRRRDGRHDREQVGPLEGEAQRSLPAHADALDSDTARPQAPALSEERYDVVDQVTLRWQRRIELRTDAVTPPRALAVRTNTGQTEVVEQTCEGGVVAQRFQPHAVQVQHAEA